jgi:hypothetical protein
LRSNTGGHPARRLRIVKEEDMATESIQLGMIMGRVTDVGRTGGTTGKRKKRSEVSEQTTPVVDAAIELYLPGEAKPITTAHTDQNGYYAFKDCKLGSRYRVVCDAFQAEAEAPEQSVYLQGTTASADFRIPIGLQIISWVETEEGRRDVQDVIRAGQPVILHADYNKNAVSKPVTFRWKSDQGSKLVEIPDGGDQEMLLQTEHGGLVTIELSMIGVNSPSVTTRARVAVSAAAAQPISGQIGVTLQRTNVPPTDDVGLWAAIRNHAKAISFGGLSKAGAVASGYQGFIDKVLCETWKGPNPPLPQGTEACTPAVPFETLSAQSRQYPLYGMTAYELLKTATEVFLLWNCGVVIRDGDVLGNIIFNNDEELARLGLTGPNPDIKTSLTNYLVQILGAGRLPYIQRIVQTAFPDELPADSVFCTGLLGSKVDCPCLIELIWSYWHEEGMLVQTLNAISRRFQNVRGPSDRDPLAHLEIDPLRPLNSLLWGYIQDERNRLTVKRRAYEYDHHYGLTLYGKAVPPLRPADSRSKFLEAFHNLLHRCSIFYQEDNDTTVIADGFPLLNALKEVHLLLAQGAHNQFGDLPWTARVEMLTQQWLVARPEIRDFLQSRAMVPYTEAWMPQVDTMKTLQGWSDVTVTHFRDLAVYGEQIVLTVRYGDWIDITDENPAKNWARYWRPEIQAYIHAYRAATGVDLTSREAVDHTMPALHLQKRLAMQRAR